MNSVPPDARRHIVHLDPRLTQRNGAIFGEPVYVCNSKNAVQAAQFANVSPA